MNNQIFRLPKGISNRSLTAYVVISAYLIAAILVGGYFTYLAIQTPTWQLWTATLSVYSIGIATIVSLVLARRGHLESGVWLTIAFSYIAAIGIVIAVSGVGPLLVLSSVFLSTMVAIQTLQTRRGTMIIAGITMGIVILFLDSFLTTERISAPGFQSLIYFILPVILAVFGYVIFRQFRDYSLRTKLIVIFVALVTIAVGTVAFLGYRNSQAALTNSADEKLLATASQIATRLDDTITNNLSTVQTEAETTEELVTFLESYANGQSTIEESANLATILKSFAQRDPASITSYALLDSKGVDVADTFAADIGVDKSNREYFQTPMKTGQPYVSPVTLSPTRPGDSDLYFSSPVRNASGQIIGVLRFSYSTKKLQNLIVQSNELAGPQSFAVLLDENYIRLAHGTTPDLVFKSVVPLNPSLLAELQAAGRLPSGTVEQLSTNLPDVAAGLQNMDTKPVFVSASSALGGSLAETAVAKMKTQPWFVYVRQPHDVFLAPITAYARTTLLLAVIVALLTAGAAAGLAQIVSTPITRLTATVDQVAAGNLNLQAKADSADETGKLASAFNQMTKQLRDLINSLESRVAERTQSLELAADVGRSISQVRALDVMLKDAAEIIRSRFDLYYVQVYLTNPSQTALVLQSGTGTVGAELVSRSHSLPLNTASLNGRAAMEKRSVVISDTASSATFRPNPLLPDTRSEMAVPLMVGEKVVGVLDMQSGQVGALSEDKLSAFEALAGQLAIAIQNANLFADVERARAEVESQAQRLARTNWNEYLDAIHQPEQTGFVFEQNQVVPLADAILEPSANSNMLTVPITITGEALGNLVVEMEGQAPISRTEELVSAVARQVAQQIESLRLLGVAERYRLDAEQAARRLTREGWKDYSDANIGSDLSYVYDLKEVRAEKKFGNGSDRSALALPLKVRDETIGKIAVSGLDSNDMESMELANTVIERLGAHIESLRLFDQTQSALAQSEKLFNASRRLTESVDLQGLVAAVVESLGISAVNRALLGVFDYGANDEFVSMTAVANWWNGSGMEATPIGTRYPVEVFKTVSLFASPSPIFFNDAFNDARADAATLALVKRLNLRAVAVLPLFSGARQIGVLMLEAESPYNFSQSEIRLFSSLAPQIATVLENRRQFENAQEQAKREAMLNVISQKIQNATTVEAVLQIAARELGHALGAPMTIAQLSVKDKK